MFISMKEFKRTTNCLVDQHNHALIDGLYLEDLDGSLQALIRRDYPKATKNDFICSEHLLHYRLSSMDQMITKDYKQNQRLNHKLTRAMKKDEYQVVDVQEQLENSLTIGQKFADAVAHFGGSWHFLLSFITFIIFWILLNQFHWFGANFDNYPFILLNLFLSIVAALQAPLIMMSQNRSSEYDRLESRNDYQVNQKSEEEIRILHSKIDHIIHQDQPNMLKIQKMQTEMLGSLEAQIAELKRLEEARLKNTDGNKD